MSISKFADAIQQMEGWKPGSKSYVNNNPGNIMDLSYYRQTGQFRVQKYSSYEEGRKALEDLISRYASQGLSIKQMMAKYAPQGHGTNNPDAYANFIASKLGVSTDAKVLEAISLSDTAKPSSVDAASNIPSPENGSGSLPTVEDLNAAFAAQGAGSLDATTIAIFIGAVGILLYLISD
jgi:hypothetical protein